MEKSVNNPNNDILQEQYAGTGRIASGFGYTTMLHYVTHAIFILGLAAAAFFAPTKAKETISWFENASARWAKEGGLKERFGRFGIWLIGVPTGTYTHLNEEIGALRKVNEELEMSEPSKELLEAVKDAVHIKERGIVQNIAHHFLSPFKLKKGNSEKWEVALVAGGFGGIISMIVSTILGFAHGAQKGGDGMQQFERSQEQLRTKNRKIRDLQADNQDLEQINKGLHEKLVKSATQHVSFQPEHHTHDAEDHADMPTTNVHHEKLHHGKLAAEPQLDAGVSA